MPPKTTKPTQKKPKKETNLTKQIYINVNPKYNLYHWHHKPIFFN
jgi:hypothetical protein